MIAYVVTSGEYSAYRIRGVFASTADANEFINSVKPKISSEWDDQYEIEEYTVGDGLDNIRAGLSRFAVYFYPNKTSILSQDLDARFVEEVTPCRYGLEAIVTVWAANEDAAIKIASERLAAHKALVGVAV